jgi:transposase
VCPADRSGREKRPAQICREHNLPQSVLLKWRREYEARGEAAFTENQLSEGEALEQKVAELERFCSKLALENEILKKGLASYHSTRGTP